MVAKTQVADKDKEHLELLQLLYEESQKHTGNVKESLSSMIGNLGFNKAICTVLRNEGIVKYPNGLFKGWKWASIKPNIETAKVLRKKLNEYINASARKVYAKKHGKTKNSEKAKHSKVETAITETTKAVNNGERKLREVRKITLDKNFKIGFTIASLLMQLDVMPTADELQEMIEHAQQMKKQIFH